MKQIKLNENLYLQAYEDGIIIHLPDDELLKIEEKTLLIDILYEIKKSGSQGKEEIYNKISFSHDISESEFDDIFQILIEHNVIKFKTEFTHSLSDKELMKFDRQIKSFATLKGNNVDDAIRFQEKIKNSNVGVLGVGGVGTYVAYGLTSMGIGKLTLIDHDHIELSNTSRQMLYNEEDIGKQKLDIARQKLKYVNPLTEIITVNKRIIHSNDLEPHLDQLDILILCADTPRGKIVYIVDEACQNKKCPFIFGLPSFNQITCGPLIIPNQTRSYKNIFPLNSEIEDTNISDSEKEKTDLINSGLVATIIDPYNAIAGKLVALETIKFLTGFLPCQLIDRVFNFDTNTLSSCITEV
ncbi:MAG: ThiF family adenylyltransferase [Legionella sp.]|nr:ThiF family adenylyltransferase [Legionella sp.]